MMVPLSFLIEEENNDDGSYSFSLKERCKLKLKLDSLPGTYENKWNEEVKRVEKLIQNGRKPVWFIWGLCPFFSVCLVLIGLLLQRPFNVYPYVLALIPFPFIQIFHWSITADNIRHRALLETIKPE